MMKSTLAVFFAGLACFVSAQTNWATDERIRCVDTKWGQFQAKYDGSINALPDYIQNSLGDLRNGNDLIADPSEEQIRTALSSGNDRNDPNKDEAIRQALAGIC